MLQNTGNLRMKEKIGFLLYTLFFNTWTCKVILMQSKFIMESNHNICPIRDSKYVEFDID